jgi:hypothetical protein
MDEVSFNDIGFRFAFGAVNYNGLEAIDDESRIEWKVTLDTYKNLQLIDSQILDVHICKEEDYQQFFPVVDANKDFLARLKEQNALFCLEQDYDIKIRGKDEIDSVALNIDLIPCQNTTAKTCANDSLETLQEFLTYPELVIYYNQ